MRTFKPLMVNDKYFSAPPKGVLELKPLVRHAFESGTGLPADSSGFPTSTWSAESLADALSLLEGNAAGIDRRTVQFWVQDNQKGISNDNIMWLSRVFGCGDPVKSQEWRLALMSAKERLSQERRRGRHSKQEETTEPKGNLAEKDDIVQKERPTISCWSEYVFSGFNQLTLPVSLWVGFASLAMLCFALGVENITYQTANGVEKQVGFLWAPSWTILPVIILPFMVWDATSLIIFWRGRGRMAFAHRNVETGWENKLKTFKPLFWLAFFMSFFVIYALQWSGVHYRVIQQNDNARYMIDWSIVTVVRPEIISMNASILLSNVAYLFFGFMMWILFMCLTLSFIVSSDINDLRPMKKKGIKIGKGHNQKVMRAILLLIYRVSLLGILFCITIKLQSTYLISGSTHILNWIYKDLLLGIGLHSETSTWLDQRGIPQVTSVLLIAFIVVIFLGSYRNIMMASQHFGFSRSEIIKPIESLLMVSTISILSLSVFLVGKVPGFSILTFGGIIFGLLSVAYFSPIRKKNPLEHPGLEDS